MIRRSDDFDLGLDKTRIKDVRDAHRQHATVDTLLERLFAGRDEVGWPLQVVADEVGMGKTFVALATAYSMLTALRAGQAPPDLAGAAQRILIITPQNSALYKKWSREVGEFVRRCVRPERRAAAEAWFQPEPVDRIDDLAARLRDDDGPAVLIAHMGVFAGGKLRRYDLKRRFLLAALLRAWGNRFRTEHRERLLKGAPDDWPRDPDALGDFTDEEREHLPFRVKEVAEALRELDTEAVLETCRDIATPYRRDRAELFGKVERQLVELYRAMLVHMVRRVLPLVIVDEAHNWKNGPRTGANGYEEFCRLIAPHARRALLLTATPFQLRPEEMLEILKVGEALAPCAEPGEAARRRQHLERHRTDVIAPVLDHSRRASGDFGAAWTRLSQSVTEAELEAAWNDVTVAAGRERLRELAHERGVVDHGTLGRELDGATRHIDPRLRDFVRAALKLYVYNADLSSELGQLVIRHRRRTHHRAFLVGDEFRAGEAACAGRPDRHILHAADGIDVRGEGEMPHYLLMRCVAEMKGGRGRTSLGSTLTGCYTTLLESSEGKAIQKKLADAPLGAMYLGLLQKLITADHDARHPKVVHVIESVVRAWRAGEKTLLFCFRLNTARRLKELLDRRIEAELTERRARCLGGAESLRALRARFTGRDRDLVVLGLDRVIWSFYWGTTRLGHAFLPDLIAADHAHDLPAIARLAIEHGVDLAEERVDRVFLHRCQEHVLARRLLAGAVPPGWDDLLRDIADPRWVSHPYGLTHEDDGDDEGEERGFDERGVHTVYPWVRAAGGGEVERLAEILRERHERARASDQMSIFDMYFEGPSLWFGRDPSAVTDEPRHHAVVRRLHQYLADLTGRSGDRDWTSRLLALQGLRRALLREEILLRLLPDRADREESQWGDLLVEHFYAALPGQTESMAERITIFVEDLVAASGSITDETSARHGVFEATRARGRDHVRLVSGETDPTTRERAFSGFNSPLLPEILVCTSVGQEGIDLHRHCRHVVHYDLAWNPAVLEQRTGRADRIGSKTFRERRHATLATGPFLEIGVPFLAGTYDERMYEELRLRAQTFEVLTGGDLAAENPEGADEDEGRPRGAGLVPLPASLVDQLRVRLHVWSDQPATAQPHHREPP